MTYGARLAAWALLGLIAMATLGPLSHRPKMTDDPQVERFLAYALIGGLFGLGHPKRRAMLVVALPCVALLLELGQLLVPGRDFGGRDIVAKSLGAVTGVGIAAILTRTVARLARSETVRAL